MKTNKKAFSAVIGALDPLLSETFMKAADRIVNALIDKGLIKEDTMWWQDKTISAHCIAGYGTVYEPTYSYRGKYAAQGNLFQSLGQAEDERDRRAKAVLAE